MDKTESTSVETTVREVACTLSNFIQKSALKAKYELKLETINMLNSYKTLSWEEMCQNSRLYLLQPECFKDVKLSEEFPFLLEADKEKVKKYLDFIAKWCFSELEENDTLSEEDASQILENCSH